MTWQCEQFSTYTGNDKDYDDVLMKRHTSAWIRCGNEFDVLGHLAFLATDSMSKTTNASNTRSLFQRTFIITSFYTARYQHYYYLTTTTNELTMTRNSVLVNLMQLQICFALSIVLDSFCTVSEICFVHSFVRPSI